MTIAEAERTCDTITSCQAITFEIPLALLVTKAAKRRQAANVPEEPRRWRDGWWRSLMADVIQVSAGAIVTR